MSIDRLQTLSEEELRLKERWDSLSADNPPLWDSLLQALRTMWAAGQSEIDSTALSQDEFKAAIALGIITFEDGKPRIPSTALLAERLGTLVRADELVGEAANDRVVESIQKCRLFDHRLLWDVHAYALIALHNDGRVNVLRQLARELGQRDRVWGVFHEISHALPFVVGSARDFSALITTVGDAVQGDMANGYFYGAVRELASRQPSVAHQILEALLESNSPVAMSFIPSILRGLADMDMVAAHGRALSISQSDHPEQVCAGLRALGAIEYPKDSADRHLVLTLARLRDAGASSDASIRAASISAYGGLLSQSFDVGDLLTTIRVDDDAMARYTMSDVLFRVKDGAAAESWFRTCLFGLARANSTEGGVCQNIDFVLSGLIESRSELVEEFLTLWCAADKGFPQRSVVTAPFGGFTGTLHKHPAFVARITKRWMLAQSLFHRDAIAGVLEHNGVSIDLDSDATVTLSPKEWCFVSRKLAGYIIAPEPLCRLVLSVVRCTDDRRVHHEVCRLFHSYIAYNYAGAASDLMETKSQSGTASEKGVAKTVLAGIAKRRDERRRVGHLKEFTPPSIRVREYERRQHRRFQKAFDEASAKSVFRQIVNEVVLKYSCRWFSEGEDGFTESSAMHAMTHEQEYPRGEQIDPVGQAYIRYRLRTEELDKFNEVDPA